MFNLNSLHPQDKALSVKPIFQGTEGKVISLQLAQNGELPRHTTATPALLCCLSGQVNFEYEGQEATTLQAGDCFPIEADKPHRLVALSPCNLLFMK